MEWKNIPDEEFSILVKPTVTQPVTFAKVSADGYISLSCKIAEKFGKKPVQIRLNRDCTAIQIAQAEGENCVIFPKTEERECRRLSVFLANIRCHCLRCMPENFVITSSNGGA